MNKDNQELGNWALPADSSQSLSLNMTAEEITKAMREHSKELQKKMESVVVGSPLSLPVSQATLDLKID